MAESLSSQDIQFIFSGDKDQKQFSLSWSLLFSFGVNISLKITPIFKLYSSAFTFEKQKLKRLFLPFKRTIVCYNK